ncbi:MAG: DNA phosphorothioation system sulfurtransferase DndC [Peptostreptococcaceae bacterium]|jgi:DNA sulfur modification protein DndC|nr:DNA phosphorothioation system sulfurtransferase DndC [Peptostreptococcaceae bacterium]
MSNGLIDKLGLSKLQESRYEEIQKVYLNDNRPWVVGYSGGKDSTSVVQLIFYALMDLAKKQGYDKLKKPVHIVSSDTLIENPLIIDYIEKNMKAIEKKGQELGLPIYSHIAQPKRSDTFWSLLIGKGYPSPRQKFRWCTSRLKIDPIDVFIKQQIDSHGEVIVVLGVRSQESQSRANSIKSHTIEGRILKKHTSTSNAFVYAPIEDFSLDDVWGYLLQRDNPWGCKNQELFNLYADSKDSSECPLQTTENAPSCGNSRFGCWVCTVVKEDKSLTGFIKSGNKELKPLLEFRNRVVQMRDNIDYRMQRRMNGSIYYLTNESGEKRKGLGPFNLKARKEMLKLLLETQVKAKKIANKLGKNTNLELIKPYELENIRSHWIDNGDWEDSLPKIYEEVMKKEYNHSSQYEERTLMQIDDLKRLSNICSQEDIDPEIIKKLISIENNYYGLKARNGILKKIDTTLKQDWVHEEVVEYMEQYK